MVIGRLYGKSGVTPSSIRSFAIAGVLYPASATSVFIPIFLILSYNPLNVLLSCKGLYDKIKNIGIKTLVADAGYKTPAIAKLLIDDGVTPLFPYKRPMTKEGFFKKYEYAYDEYYDCYICPNNQVLKYSTTNRDVRDYDVVEKAVDGKEYIIHLAAETGTGQSKIFFIS